jgi:hypothetical protein
MGTAQELSTREKVRRILLEVMPGASEENVEKAVDKLVTVIDPFERATATVLERYDNTFRELAK